MTTRRRTPSHLLARALAPLALVAACSTGPGAGEPASGGATAQPLAHVVGTGASRDLVCPLAEAAGGSTPPAFARDPATCECERAADRCRMVAIADDRRRAVVLSPSTALVSEVPGGEGGELRFAVAARGAPGSALEVRVRVSEVGGPGASEWRQVVPASARWVDGRVAARPTGGRALRVEIDVSPPASQRGADALALAAPRLVSPTASAADGAPSNVLVYLIDTLRADHTSAYGYARPTTPRLDGLARDGVVFENAYSTTAWTRPATASLLTGLFPSSHGVEASGTLSLQAVTLAERFRRAGWSTWAFVANGYVFGEGQNFDQGFDRFVAIRGRNLDNHARTSEIDDLLLPHLATFGDEPFLLYVHAVDPHSPYDPPPSHRGRFSDPAYRGPIEPKDTFRKVLRTRALDESDIAHVRDLYDEDVAYQDEMLGVLLDALAARGLLERTVVVVVADHGEELHDHGDWEHGMRLFEEQTRIPLVVRAPGSSFAHGRRARRPTQIVDVMPTLLALFSIPGAEGSQGVDLGPALRAPDEPRDDTADRPIYCEELRPNEEKDLVSLRDGRWKIIRETIHAGGTREMLFDLERDPLEQADLGAADPARLAAMRQRLDAMPAALAARVEPVRPGPPAALGDSTRRQLEALGYVVADPPTATPAASR